MKFNEYPELTTLSDNDVLLLQEATTLAVKKIKLSTLKQYVGISSSTSNIKTEILKDNPVGYWTFDELTGNTANNLGSAMSNGTYSGAALGKASLASGSDYSALFSNSASMNFTNTILSSNSNVTLECCINIQSASLMGGIFTLGAANEIGFGVGNGTYGSAGNEFIGIAGNVAWRASGKLIGTGTHHLVMIYRGSTDKNWLFYIDGFLAQTLGGTNINVPNNIGVIKQGSLQCNLDEVAIYNKVLSPMRIFKHANTVFID